MKFKEKYRKKVEKEGNDSAFESSGLKCKITRNNSLGHLCGYVGVPKGHPAFGLEGDNKKMWEINIHGGLTYAGKDLAMQPESDIWWFGFDTAHIGDALPTELLMGSFDVGIYRDMKYVTKECKNLAKQLSTI